MAATEQAIRRAMGRELRAQIRAWKAERAGLQNAVARIAVLDALIARAENVSQPIPIVADAEDVEL